EVMAVKKDGTVFPVEVQGKNYMYNDRNIRVTAIRDITERKKAKLELKKQELKFKTIFENTGYGIAVGNMDKIVVDVNASFCKMTGYQKDEIVGGRIEFLFDKQSLDKKPLRYDLLDQSKSVVHQRIIIRKDGKKVPIEMTSNKVDDNFYISFYNDLSERRKTEKELEKINQKLKKAKEKAEESNNLKTAFLQNMSHEIRTPMNGIIGFSEMLNHPDVSEERRIFYTNIIIKSSQHLLDIVNNILDISKVETGLAEVAPNETNINKLMLDLFSFYQPQAWEKNVNMHINLPLEEDESTIMVDDIKLRQVLSNLLSNALKFTHDGHIKMGYVKKRKKLEFYVEDTGIGIEGALHDKIFERFRQAELSTTRKYGGTGLGLSISQAYVKLLKGELWLISKKDEGSTFYFNIPIVKPSKRSLKIINNSINDLIDNNNAPKGQILIAEDEEFNFLYLTELLRGLGLDILHANTGMEAIEMVIANPNISLVLMDLKMPGLNGLEATKKIKKIRPELSIIAQTAYAMVEDREKAINAGCDNYISKPINRADFLNMIRKYI
ncbi:MAG: ATP-binding protein, partial [Bacteroidales bacterium]|nr:ATP-binding protein [Bacteroidales bacterium]